MAIVINGSGTISGISVGGLPDSIVDTDTLANTTVTAAKVAADVATQAEIDAKLNLAGGTLTGNTTIAVGSTPKLILKRTGNNAGNGYIECHGADNSVDYKIAFAQTAGAMTFSTATANALNIDTSGTVSFGNRHGRVTSSTGGLSISSQSDSRSFIEMGSLHTGTSILVRMLNNNGVVGQISTNGSATAFTTSSDYRLKENVDYDWDATTRLKQLKPARFNFIADDTTTVDGFIAHEAATVVPECVTGSKDAMRNETDEEGNVTSVPDMQGIDQSKLVPLLVKTIQELEARITALEA